MIEEYLGRFDNYIEDNHGDINENEYEKLMKEAKKIISKFIRNFPYENDGEEEYVYDYDYFDWYLLNTLKHETTYLNNIYKEDNENDVFYQPLAE